MTPQTDPDIDSATFHRFATRLGALERELPAPPPVEWRGTARRRRTALRPVVSGLAAFASVGLLAAAIVTGISLRGAAQTPASSTDGVRPAGAGAGSPAASAIVTGASASPTPIKGPGDGETQPAPPTDGSTVAFHAAVAGLVTDGTITQAQADVLLRQIDAGGVDLQSLVAAGTLTAAQASAVDDRLTAVKRSLSPGPDTTGPSGSSDAKKAASGATKVASDATKAADAAAHDAFLAAVQALVTDGTINQHQADVLRAGIEAGSIDENALVASGTLTDAQMKAVEARLSAVKRSFASAADGQSTSPSKSKGPSPTS